MADQAHKGWLHHLITHPFDVTEEGVVLENQTYSHIIGDFLKSANVTESGLTLLSDVSMNFGIDALNGQTTCRFNWYSNVSETNDLSAMTPIMTLSETGGLAPVLLSAPVEVYGGNEANLAVNAEDGILYLFYRGATDAITQVNLCDGKAAGILANLQVKELFADSTNIAIVAERSTDLTNTVRSAITAKATSSGNMADGFGAGIVFAIQDEAAANNYVGGVYGIRNGADNTGALQFLVANAGTLNSQMTLDQNGVLLTTQLGLTGAFGCNGAGRQASYASGGAAGGTATSGGFGFVSAAEMNAFVALLANVRTALVNNGICS